MLPALVQGAGEAAIRVGDFKLLRNPTGTDMWCDTCLKAAGCLDSRKNTIKQGGEVTTVTNHKTFNHSRTFAAVCGPNFAFGKQNPGRVRIHSGLMERLSLHESVGSRADVW